MLMITGLVNSAVKAVWVSEKQLILLGKSCPFGHSWLPIQQPSFITDSCLPVRGAQGAALKNDTRMLYASSSTFTMPHPFVRSLASPAARKSQCDPVPHQEV